MYKFTLVQKGRVWAKDSSNLYTDANTCASQFSYLRDAFFVLQDQDAHLSRQVWRLKNRGANRRLKGGEEICHSIPLTIHMRYFPLR
ncbi:hypothetical protein QJS04_geneDACA020531 [Acorus gramineus]|uniref:Uncharacterized protein n=1 Tax=Acorus gramineus TaxID=55184 RepID=A0AAV9ABU2_ACOGR|nr:hypothetical protein QJS04_geneDACA020531 [Acorus gramineus]